MKIRKGFVTNSSSSSFLISSKVVVPDDIKSHFKEYTLDNLYKSYEEEYKWYDLWMNDDLVKELNLTEEQILLVKLDEQNVLDEYLAAKEKLENKSDDEYIYHIYEDRDWLYDQESIKNFINQSKILDQKTDL